MPTVSIVRKDREQNIAQNAAARIDTHHLLRMHRGENTIAALHAEHSRYGEEVERDEASNASVALSSRGWWDHAGYQCRDTQCSV
jgi:hypothetical protein